MPPASPRATLRRHSPAATRATLLVACSALFLYGVARFGPPWPSIALISLVSPVLAGLALVGALALLALSRVRRAVVLGLLALAALVDSLHGTLWPGWPEPIAGTRPLRIVEFNAWLANNDPERASRWILAQQADAVVLLEAAGAGQRIADRLRPAFPYSVTCRGQKPCSTVILSRTAPIETRPFAHGDADNRRALSAVLARFPSYTLVAVHLSRPTSAERQIAEMEELAAGLSLVPRWNLVITGDFNSPLWTLPMRRLSDALDLRAIAPDTPSWPVPQPGSRLPAILPIDHTLIGAGWSAARQVRGPAIGSDHYPALIELLRRDDHDAH